MGSSRDSCLLWRGKQVPACADFMQLQAERAEQRQAVAPNVHFRCLICCVNL